jgi:hypothetical protein
VPEIRHFSTSPYTDARHRAFPPVPTNDVVGWVKGELACAVARQICHHLNVDYDFAGVDATHRSCCENLLTYLKT